MGFALFFIGMLANKVILVTGIANGRSIAWYIAKVVFLLCILRKKLYREKASLIITYQRPEFKNKIDALIKDELTLQDVFQYIQYYLKSKQLVSTFCCNAIEEDDLQQLQTFICTS